MIQFVQIRKFIQETLSKHYKDGDFAFMSADCNIDFLAENEAEYVAEVAQILDHPIPPSIQTMKGLFDLAFSHQNRLFTIHNVYFDHHKKYEITHGDFVEYHGTKVPVEQVITDRFDWCLEFSLDHIWEIKMKDSSSKFRVVDKSSKIERFMVKGKPYLFISDHYGVSVKVRFD